MSSHAPASSHSDQDLIDSPYAWRRLALSLLVSTIGSVGLWSSVVVLPEIEAEFGIGRGEASLPYSLTMVAFAFGGVLMGKIADRRGITVPLQIGAVALCFGYVGAGLAGSLWQFILAQSLLIGFLGSSGSFGPMLADISHWFNKSRGIAVAVAASGSYMAGTVWPPVVQYFTDNVGWRETHMGIGVFCVVTLLPLSLLLKRRPPQYVAPKGASAAADSSELQSPFSPRTLQWILIIAGLACCIAMAMPQVHIVAYCIELGYQSQRGSEMLSLMLATGIVSRLGFGWISDQIGPLKTLLLGSSLQALTLLLFLPFDGLVSLYVVSALFGLAQGGIVPTYTLIVRKFFPASEAGSRVSIVISATIVGMALGGWMTGEIFDIMLSYEIAFLNGIAWNVLHVGIASLLLFKLGGPPRVRMA